MINPQIFRCSEIGSSSLNSIVKAANVLKVVLLRNVFTSGWLVVMHLPTGVKEHIYHDVDFAMQLPLFCFLGSGWRVFGTMNVYTVATASGGHR